MKSLCSIFAVLCLSAAAFCQVSPPKPVNVHIVGRHAEGWYPGAQPRLVTETHSWPARHLLGRHNTSHFVMPAAPAGVTGCHEQTCVFADNWVQQLRTTGGAH